ncbi:rhodanese-like domain-containing protein [Blastococcus sp. Marseille-P5729]|uniref:rhodanese-like domain-containing protein n=1 Tax=Blastococcus sp. Marseille-P5729 TaxID=2086582 RepID=UPI000D10AF9B|nr:rhodanese-like domain-containing protein [Blastococcus sp. Marseille-P5729]
MTESHEIKPVWGQVEKIKESLENLSVDETAAEIDAGDDRLLVVDIREIQERVDSGAIPGSKHVPRGMLEFWADPASEYYRDYFTPDKRIVLYCAGGGRSALAAQALKDMGFPDVAHVEEGFTGWAKAGRPVEDVASSSRWVRRDR